jgi:hypothetical protein
VNGFVQSINNRTGNNHRRVILEQFTHHQQQHQQKHHHAPKTLTTAEKDDAGTRTRKRNTFNFFTLIAGQTGDGIPCGK